MAITGAIQSQQCDTPFVYISFKYTLAYISISLLLESFAYSEMTAHSPVEYALPGKIPWTLKITSTEVHPIDVSEIKFQHSEGPLHPFDDAKLLTAEDSITGKALKIAAEALNTSVVPVAFPTETVYGLGANATNDEAVKNIFAVKNRYTDNPLIVHVGTLKQARDLMNEKRLVKNGNIDGVTTPTTPGDLTDGVLTPTTSDDMLDGATDGEQVNGNRNGNGNGNSVHDLTEMTNGHSSDEHDIPEVYKPLIDKFWPGPLTILLPLPIDTVLSPYVYANQITVGVRMPSHPVALALAIVSGVPIAAPSANKSGFPSPTTAAHVAEDLHKRIEIILDGGACSVGVESTVVDGLSDPPAILRPGGVSLEQIRACGGVWTNVVVHKDVETVESISPIKPVAKPTPAPRAPGMKYKHYSPSCGVKLYMPGAAPPTTNDLVQSGYGQENAKVGILRTRTWKEGLGDKVGSGLVVIDQNLGSRGEDISRNLFGALRGMDDHHVTMVHVEGISEDEEGLAVMNRLKKAASVIVGKPSCLD